EGGRVMTLPEAERASTLLHWRSLSRRAGRSSPNALGRSPEPGAGDVDRAVRQALVGLWTPPAIEKFQRPRAGIARYAGVRAGFEAPLGKLRRACGLSVDSWGVVHELSIGDHARN